jgi:hypothetical protein
MIRYFFILVALTLSTLLLIQPNAEAKNQGNGGGKKDRGTIGVPKTGQNTCIDVGNYAIDCEGTGQDGEWQTGVILPDPRFTHNGDQTITDNLTALMWTEDADLFRGRMRWFEALTACNDLFFAGYDDWRLPNIRELFSLVDFGEKNPALPYGHSFTNVDTSGYWSSTYRFSIGWYAFRVVMGDGFVDVFGFTDPTHLSYAWCVRGGK